MEKDYTVYSTDDLRGIARGLGIRNGGPTGVRCDRMTRDELLAFFRRRQSDRSAEYEFVARQLAASGEDEIAACVRRELCG